MTFLCMILIGAHLPHGLSEVRAMERKRPEYPIPAGTVQEGPPVKHAKLVLKPPKFLTAAKPQHQGEALSSLLEGALELETSEDVLGRLLELLNSHKLETLLEEQESWPPEEVGKCIGCLGKLAKTYREQVSVCCVLVHIVELLGTRLGACSDGLLPKNYQLFALSLVDHGESLSHPDRGVGKCF